MDHRNGDREHRPVHDRTPDPDLTSLDRLGPRIPAEVLEACNRLPTKPDPVVLIGERVRVRPATLDDAVELFTISNGEPVTRLGRSTEAYDADAALSNLMLAPFFEAALSRAQQPWREVVALAVTAGIPVPAMSASLAYYDAYRSARLPANLLQAQRDFFGAHTYERVDRPAGQMFHTEWPEVIG